MNNTMAMNPGDEGYVRRLKETTEYTGVHPQKFALWAAIASMTMFFAALTSALILKKGDFKSWENFKLPSIFMISTVMIIGVSLCMHLSLISYKRAKFSAYRVLLLMGWLLGIAFLLTQWQGFNALKEMGMPLTGNISGQFVYLVASLHGAHIAIALLITLVVLIFGVRARKDMVYEASGHVNPRRRHHMEMLVTFWHYIDIVWIYLYLFFYLNYQ